ncbi:MAG: SpvB/TcaC N-terminal domain-containing protein, partial [Bacteroidota bacterium]
MLTFNTTQPAGTYVARDQINCLPGSRFTANASSSWTLSVDKNVIASINANGNPYSGYSINSVYTIDKNLPVGSINGNYSVNNGQLNYNIGIPMAPGTAGFMPNLAITYNGSLSDGLLGVGWNISGISKISRATAIIFDQAGYPSKATSPINLDHNDNVYLDGNRLSGLIIGSPANAPTVRLENDNFTEVTEILSIPGNSSSTVNSYSVLTKDGIKMEYGYTADSKLMVTNSAGNSVPLSYYVNKVTDKLGNYYTYEYYNVNGEVAIKEIKYTGNVIAGISPYNSIKFYYDTRQDKNTKYILGNKLNSSFILREIELFCEGVSYKRFVPKYDFLNARTHLTSITEYGADNSSLNPTKFAYDINNALNSGILKASTIPSLPLLADYNIADFDGDGIDDALAYCYTTDGVNKAYTKWELYIRDNTDFGFIKKAESPFGSNFVPYSFYGSISNDSPENGKIIGNFNGDNKQDMLMLKNEGINTTYYPYFSTGSGFVAGPSFVFPSGGAVILADINGDQIPEAIGNGNYAGNTGSLRVHSFLDNTTKFISLNYQQVVGAPYKIMSTIDYDGDGSQELLVELLGNYKVLKITDPWPSNASFNLQTSILDYDAGIDLINPDIENVKLGFGDFNEDGLTDQIYSGQVSTTKLFLRYGTRKHNTFNNSFFSTPAVPLVHALPLTNDINSEFVIADMNNDGKSDIVTLEKNKNGTTNGTYVYITYGHDIA